VRRKIIDTKSQQGYNLTQSHSAVLPQVSILSNDPNEPSQLARHEPPQASPREVNSRDLMQGDREIVIRHGTQAYRLSVTRSGKLILRK
jgi:hemin uptake protein HemP